MYPEYVGRMNVLYDEYAEIAMEHYYNAEQLYTQLISISDVTEAMYIGTKIVKDTIICITYSHMALESFFNDYLATCLGDDIYYDSFDSLNPIQKFTFISKLILNRDIDKGQSYYGLLKELNKNRNALMHTKSKNIPQSYMIKNTTNEEYMDMESLEENILKDEITDAKINIRNAFNGLKALYQISKYIDYHDKNAYAEIRLFGQLTTLKMLNATNKLQYKIDVLTKLKNN